MRRGPARLREWDVRSGRDVRHGPAHGLPDRIAQRESDTGAIVEPEHVAVGAAFREPESEPEHEPKHGPERAAERRAFVLAVRRAVAQPIGDAQCIAERCADHVPE